MLVPFVSSEDDCQLVDDFYSDAEYFRIELRNWTKIENSFGQADKLWVDAGVDGNTPCFEGKRNHQSC